MSLDSPTYNLKAVVQATGVKPETLRAWERRYGIPRPERSGGGHRIYSRRDIDTLHWLVRRQKEGLSISRAAERWHAIERAGGDPLQEPGLVSGRFLYRERWTSTLPVDAGIEQEDDGQIGAAREEWLAACLAYNEGAAVHALAQAFARFSVETVCHELLCQGLRQLGEAWHTDHVSVQQVHFATALAMQRIEILLGASPHQSRPGQILLAGPPEEHHAFGLALLQLLLKRRGFGTVCLGANVPLIEMESTLKKIQPALVILSAQQLCSAGNLLEMSELVAGQDVPVAFGGRIFNLSETIRRGIPGHFLGADLKRAVASVERLLDAPARLEQPTLPPATYRESLSNFLSNLPQISAHVWTAVHNTLAGQHTYAQANSFLAKRIISALRFGDLSLLGVDAEWLCILLQRRHLSVQEFERYLSNYQSAILAIQGSSGEPVVEMLELFLERFQSAARRREVSENGRREVV